MNGFNFLFDIGCSVLSFADDGGPDPFVPGDWFQLAKTGTFFSLAYGKVTISKEDLQKMHRNFKEITPKAPTQLPIDYDHLSDDPKNPGDGRAAGWVEDLELRDNGDELWCRPKWTKPAAQMIAAGEYRFVSPMFVTNYMDKQSGKKVGPTLKAVAITNRPFLEGMDELPSIAASDTAAKEFGSDKKVAVQLRQTVALRSTTQGDVMKSEPEKDSKSLADAPPMLTCPQCGAPVSNDGSHMKGQQDTEKKLEGVKKALDEADGDGPDADDIDEGSEGTKKGEKKMSEEVKVSETEKALREEVRQLSEKNLETEKALKEIQDGNKKQKADVLIQRALREGKITPKMVGEEGKPGWARAFADRDAAGFETWLEEAPKLVQFGEQGTGSEKAAEGAAGTAMKIDELVTLAMSENKSLRYADATKKVLSENRALAEAYDKEMIGERSPASAPSGVRRL